MSNKEEYFIIGKRAVIEALRAHYPLRLVIFERGISRDEIIKSIYNHAKSRIYRYWKEMKSGLKGDLKL